MNDSIENDMILVNLSIILVGAVVAIVAAWNMDHLGAVVLTGLILIYVGSLRFK